MVFTVTIPQHCSDKIQSLDVGIFRSTKGSYNDELHKWMCNHPEKTVSIYDIVELFGVDFYRNMTPSNICSVFKATVIFPLNPDVFAEELYLCSLVTNHPYPPELEEDEPADDVVKAVAARRGGRLA